MKGGWVGECLNQLLLLQAHVYCEDDEVWDAMLNQVQSLKNVTEILLNTLGLLMCVLAF